LRAGVSVLQEIARDRDCRKVLRCLGAAHGKGETLTPVELSSRTGLSVDAVCDCLADLEARGLVT
jgi:DNA-binding IclR family transcriptional regulator